MKACGKNKPDPTKLGFGKYFTDNMLVATFENGKWSEPEITPYAPFVLDPSCAVLHYGQEVFEGMKAYKGKDGRARLFRPLDNLRRLNDSCERMCIPPIDVDKTYSALCELIKVDSDWIPSVEGTSLYIRPAIIATEQSLGVHASNSYIFFVILSPVGAYYKNGLSPVKLYVENEYVRACIGGTGHHKFGGNYAASLRAGEIAAGCGCDQVLWLDARDHKYIEEVGSMNIFFIKDGKAITPSLGGSILPGITRRSVLTLLKNWGIECEERRISLSEILDGIANGSVTEAFGTGTAAVISPVGTILTSGKEHKLPDGIGSISQRLYEQLTGIQLGSVDDRFGWSVVL